MLQRKRSPIADLPSGVGICESTNGNGQKFWRVRLGKRFTGGAPIAKHFKTLQPAREWIKSQIAQRSQLHSTALSPDRLAEAKSCFSKLEALGMSLSEAVDYAIRFGRPPGGIKSIEETITAFQNSKRRSGRDKKYIDQLGWCLRTFSEDFPNEKVHDITLTDIEGWLGDEEFQPVTRKNYVRDLKMLFKFALEEEWSATNPAARLTAPKIPDAEIQVLSVADTHKLLETARLVPHEEMCAAIAIKLFAGLRTSEIKSLDWEQVKSEEIIVLGRIAKSRQRRVVSIEPNLAKWLALYREESGPVAPPRGWRRRYDALRDAAEVLLPKNTLRHNFGSYYYAKTRDDRKTASAMGNSPEMVFRHYRGIVEAEPAKKYWEIEPACGRGIAPGHSV